MSTHHAGTDSPREYKTCRILMSVKSINSYECIEGAKPTLSRLLNELLRDWLINEQLKIEFKKVNK